MIIVLKGADFSANNIGQIDIDIEISPFTTAAIAASGNASMTNAQQMQLERFFTAMGAKTGSGIWAKMDMVYLPFIGAGLPYAMVNYKTNATDFTPDSSYWAMSRGGIKPSDTVPAASGFTVPNYVFDYTDKSIVLLNTESLGYFASTQTSIGVSTAADSTLNSYKNMGFMSSAAGSGYAKAYFRLAAGAQAVAASSQIATDPYSDCTTRVISSDETNISVLHGDGTYNETEWPSGASGLLDRTPHDLWLFSSWTSASTNTNHIGCGALMLGSSLTEGEMRTIKAQLDALYATFYS